MAEEPIDREAVPPQAPPRQIPVVVVAVLALLAAAGVAAVTALALGSGAGTAASPAHGPVLPAFEVTTLDGSRFVFPTGRPTALYFTGSTCASCLPKAAALDRIEREGDGDLAVLGVDVDGFDTEEMFRDWIAHVGAPRHDFAMDRDFELLDRFEVAALSTVIIADGEGRLVWRSADDVGETALRSILADAGLTRARAATSR